MQPDNTSEENIALALSAKPDDRGGQVLGSVDEIVRNVAGKNKKKIGKAVAIGGAVLVVAAIVALVVSGVMYVGFKSPTEKVAVRTVVCGDDIVERANNLAIPFDDSSWKKFDILVQDIKSKSNYQNDPTCQSVLYFYAWQKGNKIDMKSAFDALRNLNDQGLYVDNTLRMNIDVGSMNGILAGMDLPQEVVEE